MRLILLPILLISFSVFAEGVWYKDEKLVEDNLWQKHDGKFKAQLFISDDPKTIYKQWNEGPANKVRFVDVHYRTPTNTPIGKRGSYITGHPQIPRLANEEAALNIANAWVRKEVQKLLGAVMNTSHLFD